MRNFIIFFEGKEGTSALVRLLDKFESVSVIRPVSGSSAWEPFNKGACGPTPLWNLGRCLDIIYNDKPIDFERLNRIYTRTARSPIEEFDRSKSVGLKMRFVPPMVAYKKEQLEKTGKPFPMWERKLARSLFKRLMFYTLKKYDVVAFIAVRQDILRWSLSKYHGSGSAGKAGHLQFKLAKGEIRREELDKIYVDCARFGEIVNRCQQSHAGKRRLMADLRRAGIQSYPLCYEDFLAEKPQLLARIFNILELEVSGAEIEGAIAAEAFFKKVHSNNIADFVENHEEVEARFGDRFVPWSQEMKIQEA